MAIIQAFLTAITRSLGKILNTALGWATAHLFGKVPARKQSLLSAISLGAVVWFICLLGTIAPSVATFLLAFVTLPDWVEENWVRLAMLGFVVVIPLVVGAISIVLVDEEDRPEGVGGKLKTILKGYPYVAGLSITIVLMMLFAPLMKVRALAKRWESQHIAIHIDHEDYDEVLGAIQRALGRGGIDAHRERASWMLRFPTKVLAFFAGSSVAQFVVAELTTLVADGCEVLVHPSDLVVSGKSRDAARAHAVVSEHLTFTKAYMTWDKEAHALEDRLREIWVGVRERGRPGVLDRKAHHDLEEIEKDLRKLPLPYEEWEILYREKLQVERALLGTAAGLKDYVGAESAVERLAKLAA